MGGSTKLDMVEQKAVAGLIFVARGHVVMLDEDNYRNLMDITPKTPKEK